MDASPVVLVATPATPFSSEVLTNCTASACSMNSTINPTTGWPSLYRTLASSVMGSPS